MWIGPIPVVVRSDVCVCTAATLLRLGIQFSPGEIDIYLLWVVCVVRERSLRRADHSSRGVLPIVVCLSVIVGPQNN
jgi:hypothetical protein